MTSSRARKSATNHLVKGSDWDLVKAYWRKQRGPCARCGGAIDYTEGATGRDALDVGHIVSRAKALAMGWTRQQINAIGNTQPEHRRCNRRAGAIEGNAARSSARPRPLEAGRW